MPNHVFHLGEMVRVRPTVVPGLHNVRPGDELYILEIDGFGRILVRNLACQSTHPSCVANRSRGGCGYWSELSFEPIVIGPRCNHICYPNCICEGFR
jgi:hypothetical protein